jgi:hypothetical protein
MVAMVFLLDLMCRAAPMLPHMRMFGSSCCWSRARLWMLWVQIGRLIVSEAADTEVSVTK